MLRVQKCSSAKLPCCGIALVALHRYLEIIASWNTLHSLTGKGKIRAAHAYPPFRDLIWGSTTVGLLIDQPKLTGMFVEQSCNMVQSEPPAEDCCVHTPQSAILGFNTDLGCYEVTLH